MRIHVNFFATATWSVFACLSEKEILDIEVVVVDWPSRSLNPFGQVPVLEDGNIKLFDSRAITSYIAHVYADKGTQLMFLGPNAYLWSKVEANQFDPVASRLCSELVFNPKIELETDNVMVVEKAAKLGEILDIYETRLAQSNYLGGDNFSLADLHHIPCIHFLKDTKVWNLFQLRPNVSAWCTRILARQAWRRVVDQFDPNHS